MTKIINELSVNMCKLTKVKNWREKRQKNIFFFEKSLDKTRNMLYNYMAFAGVAESADAHVWGACIFDVRVQVPFPAPSKKAELNALPFCLGETGQFSGKPSNFALKTIINRFLNVRHFPHQDKDQDKFWSLFFVRRYIYSVAKKSSRSLSRAETGQTSAIASVFVLKTLIKSFLYARHFPHQDKDQDRFWSLFFVRRYIYSVAKILSVFIPRENGTVLGHAFCSCI